MATLNTILLDRGWKRTFGMSVASELATAEFPYWHCTVCDLRFFDDLLAGSGALYRNLELTGRYYTDFRPEFDIVRGLLPASGKVLEIGPGEGGFGSLLASNGLNYVGLELNPLAAGRARAKGLDVRQETLAQHLSSGGGSYDAVVAIQVAEHVGQVGGFLDDCIAATHPGGTLVISVPAFDGFMGTLLDNYLDMPPHHLSHWSDRCLRELGQHKPLVLADLVHEQVTPDLLRTIRVQGALNRLGFARTSSPQGPDSVRYRLARTVARGIAALPSNREAMKGMLGHAVTAAYHVSS